MNQDLIDKLTEQAQKYADDWGKGESVWTDLFDSKFAELIVKECAKALNPMLRDMISRGEAVDLILKHFGVEP